MDLGPAKPASDNRQPARRWLSFALIAAGLVLLVVAAGLLWWTNRPAAAPAPLGLADNPLPVVAEEPIFSPEAAISPLTMPEPPADPSPVSPATSTTVTALIIEPTVTPLPAVPEPPVRIVAPAIGLDAPVVPVGWKIVLVNGKQASVWEVTENAAGWHKGSVVSGQVGNTVLSGHHNIGGEVFRYVVDLEPRRRSHHTRRHRQGHHPTRGQNQPSWV